jgi:hypothetical protein
MNDDGVPTPSPAPNPPPASADPAEALEQRVRRLEDALAELQDTRPLEERVAERVTQRVVPRLPAPSLELPERQRDSAPVVVNATRRLLPAALSLVRSPRPKTPTGPGTADVTTPDLRTPWFLFECVAELRAMWRMILDPHYRLTWPARAVLLGVIPFIVTSSFWVPFTGLPLVGTIFDKLIDLALAFFAWKVLGREVALYRRAIADLPVHYRSAV